MPTHGLSEPEVRSDVGFQSLFDGGEEVVGLLAYAYFVFVVFLPYVFPFLKSVSVCVIWF